MNRTLRSLVALTALVVAGGLGVATRTHAQALTTGTIAGTVKDANGNNLPGVQISVDSGEMEITNASGYYVISDILPGAHIVKAALVGYQSVSASVTVTQELTSTVDLTLSQRETVFTGVQTVIAPLIRKNVTPTLYTVTSKEEQLVRSQPNNLYQYPGALISQPGIVPNADGYPTVRGSRANEVGYMLDGILIVSPDSANFATNLVTVGMDRMNVYTGGYRAELGSAIGGIINSVVKTGTSMRGQAAVEASTGSWDYSGVVYEQGDVEKNGFNWYVSGNFFRTRYEKNHQIAALPASADGVLKLIHPLGKNNRFTLMYTGGFEHYDYPLDDPFTGRPWGESPLPPTDPNFVKGVSSEHSQIFDYKTGTLKNVATATDYQNQMHHIGSLTWAHQFSNTSTLTAQTYAWDRRVDLFGLSDYIGQDFKSRNQLRAGKIDWSNSLSPNFQLRVGGELIGSGNANELVVPSLSGYHRLRGADTTDLNGYLSATFKPSDRIVADLGLRYDSRTYHREITPEMLAQGSTSAGRRVQEFDRATLEKTGMDPKYDEVTPRIGVTYTLTPKTLLKASGGRFLQFAPSNIIEHLWIDTPSIEPDDGNRNARNRRKVYDVSPEKVDGFDVGIETELTNRLGLAVTPYWRKSKDLFNNRSIPNPNYDPALPPTGANRRVLFAQWDNSGRGETRGVETKLQMRERNGLSGWLTYTYQKAKANTTASSIGGSSLADPSDPNRLWRLDFDQKHTVYVVAQYQKGNFEINPLLELGSGYPWGGQADIFTGNQQYAASPVSTGTDEEGEPTYNNLPILVNGQVQSTSVNPYNTGWHTNLSVTFRLYNNKQKSSYYFLQVQNILNSKDVTAKYWQDPNTGSSYFGYVPGATTYIDENGATATNPDGHFEYKPWTRIAPVFVLVGVKSTF